MNSENHKKFIKKSYEEYKKIGYVECPAFASDKVYFTKIGFNHLLWKGKKMRKPEEQVKRIDLIPKAVEIIKYSTKWKHYREDTKLLNNGSISNANFWSFSIKVSGIEIRVIIRQSNNGKKYFLSVM